ncbi:MAG TPA: hypothetical protein VEG68_18120 [Terriglobales bacterium]|nr:hypothetical protein [Terriglobales bacterium]
MHVSRIYPIFFVAVMAIMAAGCGAPTTALPDPVSNTAANSVTMTYEGHEGIGPGGYPYYVSINGSSDYTPLMCDSFDNSVALGETWKATVNPFLTGTGLFGPTTSLDYRAAGLIFKDMLAGALTSEQAQWAVWGLFSSDARSRAYFSSIDASAIESTYLSLAATESNSSYEGLFLYTPIAGTQSSGRRPQEFMSYSTGEGSLELTKPVFQKPVPIL